MRSPERIHGNFASRCRAGSSDQARRFGATVNRHDNGGEIRVESGRMEYFARLAQTAYRHWNLRKQDVLAFPESAAAALHELQPSEHIRVEDVPAWVASCESLPIQVDPGSTFGEPPVTVFNDGVVAVDIYFWLTSTIGIHDHGFAGAFSVVEGSSIEVEYDFSVNTRYNESLMSGALQRRDICVNRKGAVRPIAPGRDFIHSLFHLDSPSVSLVIRTNVPSALPQLEYWQPGIAIRTSSQDSVVQRRRMGFVPFLGKTRPDALGDYLLGFAQSAAPQDVLHALRSALPFFRNDIAALNDLLRELKPRLGSLVDDLVTVIKRQGRIEALTRLREVVTDPQTRLLLAVLLHAQGRDELLELVALVSDPLKVSANDEVLRLFRGLHDQQVQDPVTAALSQCDQNALVVGLELALRGDPTAAILQVMRTHADASIRANADGVGEALTRSPLLAPLFSS